MSQALPVSDPNFYLPEDIVVRDLDDVLYRIGLCHSSVSEQPKRRSIDNPTFAFVITLIFITEKVITCSLSEDNELVFRMLASTGHFLSIRLHDLFFILCSVLSLVSQLIYYYNHKQASPIGGVGGTTPLPPLEMVRKIS